MIVIVSGLPRSGTSLMMQMLQAGGLPVLADALRPADAHNPRGYLEYHKVRTLQMDASWIAEADGRVVKVVSQLLYFLPPEWEYRVIFMRRRLDEVLRSQQQMLVGLGQPTGPDDGAMHAHFSRHLQALHAWVEQQPNIRLLSCDYHEIMVEPSTEAGRVSEFLEQTLDVDAMAGAVAPELHRQRSDAGHSPGPAA